MEENRQRVRREPDSLAPIQLERIDLDEAVAQMRGDNRTTLTLSLLAGLLAVAGTIHWLDRVDDSRAYAVAAQRVDALDIQHSTSFLRCAVPELQHSQLTDRQALHTAIELASERFDKAYGRQLQRCEYLLDELETSLAGIQAPADMTRHLNALRVAGQELRAAWNTYREYLQDPKLPYDYVQATPLIEKVTLAWDAYQGQQATLKAALRARQEPEL